MQQIRILQYVGSLNIGGSQTMIMELYRNIDHKKIQFDFIIDKPEDIYFKKEIEQLGGKVYVLPNYTGKNHFAYKKAWNEFFKEHKQYKIIHSHIRSTASIVLKIAKKYGLITIAHSHNTSNGNGLSSLIKRIYQFKIRYVADYFFGCSKDSCIWLFGNKISKTNKCFVLNNSIHTDKFLYNDKVRNEVRNKFNLNNKFVIGNVGRYAPVKNHTFLIDIFYELQKKHQEAFLLLVGDESHVKQEIIRKISSLKIDSKVLVLSNRNDVSELLQAMDVFVMPSLYEGLPVTLIEAQASGVPIVMSKNITDEVIITNLISKISLDEKIETWVETIENLNNFERSNKKNDIVSAGYDIKKNVEWLESFYKKIYKEGD